jgi:hypothetical protein
MSFGIKFVKLRKLGKPEFWQFGVRAVKSACIIWD